MLTSETHMKLNPSSKSFVVHIKNRNFRLTDFLGSTPAQVLRLSHSTWRMGISLRQWYQIVLWVIYTGLEVGVRVLLVRTTQHLERYKAGKKLQGEEEVSNAYKGRYVLC
jgi:hypothetical protein